MMMGAGRWCVNQKPAFGVVGCLVGVLIRMWGRATFIRNQKRNAVFFCLGVRLGHSVKAKLIVARCLRLWWGGALVC